MNNGTHAGLEFVDVDLLKPHPRNVEIYGDPREQADFNQFVELVRKNGIHPLMVSDEMTIVGGHRRYYAALALGIPFVHASLYHFESENDVLAALIADNQVRDKDNWQMANEAVTLKEIESVRAKMRQANSNEYRSDRSNGNDSVVQVLAPLIEVGKAREKVGEQLGVSGQTVSDLIKVKERVDDLEAKGEIDKAEELIDLLNKSVEKAAKETKRQLRAEIPVAMDKHWISLSEWEVLTKEQQDSVLTDTGGDGKFNKQSNASIEWALFSWNPLTGCRHGCGYCYARDIAREKYLSIPLAERFEPMLYPARLSMPSNTKVPDLSKVTDEVQRIGLRNVFTCSMADLFGKWNPDAWIKAVLQVIADNPQWNFLLLTKFPIRMAEFSYPPNTWIGTTVDRQAAVQRAEKAFRKVRASGYQGVAWLSCEPMMERLTFESLDMFDWLVMGGASRSSETLPFAPPQRWISHLVAQADACHLPIYQKTNLFQQNGVDVDFDGRIRDYPV